MFQSKASQKSRNQSLRPKGSSYLLADDATYICYTCSYLLIYLLLLLPPPAYPAPTCQVSNKWNMLETHVSHPVATPVICSQSVELWYLFLLIIPKLSKA